MIISGNNLKYTPSSKAGVKIDVVQALRFIASILVVFYHLPHMELGQAAAPTLSDLVRWGGAGVDIFFVISGFIIMYSSAGSGSFSAIKFLRNRIDRIYPTYWVILLATVSISIIMTYYGIQNATSDKLTYYGFFVSIFLAPFPLQIMPVAWTLGMEMTFYIIFSIAYKFYKLRSVVVSILIWYALSMIYKYSAIGYIGGSLSFLLHSISLEFLFGVLIAHAFLSNKMPFGLLALACGIFVATLSATDALDLGSVGREFRWGIPAALIVYGCVALRPRIPRWLMLAGDASYALYLTHTISLSIVSKILIFTMHDDMNSSSLLQVVSVVFCVFVSIIILLLVERPLRGLLRSRRSRSLERVKV